MKLKKPTLPEVVPEFAAYYRLPRKRAWGVFHVILDDGNTAESIAREVWEELQVHTDPQVRRLAWLLFHLSPTQRGKLSRLVDSYINDKRCVEGGAP